MNQYVMRLTRDRHEAADLPAQPLPALNRVLYVLDGQVVIVDTGGRTELSQDSAWHGAEACMVRAVFGAATVLRYELLEKASVADGDATVSRPLSEHPIDLDPQVEYLMRCDRVDFEPGGMALPHGHAGGGIRCLIAGTLELTIGDRPPGLMQPGDAWFESGREPVLAVASKDAATSFIRCSILPRSIRGKSSIWYADPKDAERSEPRKYTVYVDQPIRLE
jgi:hypothetical protein